MKQRPYIFAFVALLFFPILVMAQDTIPQKDTIVDVYKHVKFVSPIAQRSVKTLAAFLTQPFEDDSLKVKAIALWVASNVKYDAKAFMKNKPSFSESEKVLKKKKAVCFGYSNLFNDLCSYADITSETVPGYSKSVNFEPNGVLFKADHAWNVIYFNRKWYLFDVTYASGYVLKKDRPILSKLNSSIEKKSVFIPQLNENHFYLQPQKAIMGHLPVHPMWQLLKTPIPLEKFLLSETALTAYLDSLAGAGLSPYKYHDSIMRYLVLDDRDRPIKAAKMSIDFNPDNHRYPGVKYMENAVQIMKETGVSGWSLEKKMVEYDTAYARFDIAYDFFKAYQRDSKSGLKDRQGRNKQIKKDEIKRLKTLIRQTDKYIAKTEKLLSNKYTEISKLEFENKNLKKENAEISAMNIQSVKNASKEPDEEALEKFNENAEKINQNNQEIALLKSTNEKILSIENSSLKDSLWANRTIIDSLNNQVIVLLKHLVHIKNNYIPSSENELRQISDSIAEIKALVYELRQQNQEKSQATLLMNQEIIESNYKDITSRIKSNAQLIKTNKRISLEQNNVDSFYVQQINNWVEENEKMIAVNKAKISENLTETIYLKRRKKTASDEKKLYERSIKIENARWKKYHKKYYQTYKIDKSEAARLLEDAKKGKELAKEKKNEIKTLIREQKK